jgi:alpha-galactosidase
MADEMLVAQEEWLPQYAKSIPGARQRMSDGGPIKTKCYQGAARLHTKTVDEMQAKSVEMKSIAAESDKAKSRPSAQ